MKCIEIQPSHRCGWAKLSATQHPTLRPHPCRSAGSSVCAGLKTGYEHLASDPAHKEKVTFLKFGSLECRGGKGVESSCPALLLGLDTGFHLWSLGNSVKEIVSRRDGPARSAIPTCTVNPMPHRLHHSSCTGVYPPLAVCSNKFACPDGKPQIEHCT